MQPSSEISQLVASRGSWLLSGPSLMRDSYTLCKMGTSSMLVFRELWNGKKQSGSAAHATVTVSLTVPAAAWASLPPPFPLSAPAFWLFPPAAAVWPPEEEPPAVWPPAEAPPPQPAADTSIHAANTPAANALFFIILPPFSYFGVCYL